MRVRLIAWTVTDEAAMREVGWVPYMVPAIDQIPVTRGYGEAQHPDEYTFADQLAEFAGRACYLSWRRPNPATSTNRGYMKNILNHGHVSTIDHASAVFFIDHSSRSWSHEMARHRHMGISHESTRYAEQSDHNIVLPPDGSDEEREKLLDLHEHALEVYEFIRDERLANGQTKKEAMTGARSALIHAHETQMVVSGNLRAWRELLLKRYAEGVDKEFYLIAEEILTHLKRLAPNSFQDINIRED